ncbi:hypothetical protein J4731_20190 [Providencia rettgeri]|nr:hypothetical protein [Providencia rettgeri]
MESVIWQVDINTGSLLTQLKANMVLGLDAEIIKVTLVDDQLYITLTERSTGSTVENTYRLIQSDKLELVSVVNNRLLLITYMTHKHYYHLNNVSNLVAMTT